MKTLLTDTNVMFAICDLESDTHIGNAKISQINWIHRSAFFGWLIGRQDFRARGFGTYALIQLLRFGFHRIGLNRLAGAAVVENVASLACCDKVEMIREGTFRELQFSDGQFHDAVSFSMLRAEFDAIHGDSETWDRREKEWRKKFGGS
jgi:RimJ/RimL family protein N-acetyltransferase